MAELPVDVYEIDFKTDLLKARESLGRDEVICGNIDTLNVMLNGSVDRVQAEAEKCHRICGERHIVAPGCETAPLTPVENVRALVAYAATTGRL
jgi:[methyl-Co(III) methanol-specific corrinoid protein]:coenzyme M methyltransferase